MSITSTDAHYHPGDEPRITVTEHDTFTCIAIDTMRLFFLDKSDATLFVSAIVTAHSNREVV